VLADGVEELKRLRADQDIATAGLPRPDLDLGGCESLAVRRADAGVLEAVQGEAEVLLSQRV
jgi:hypothetical protein